MVRKIFGFFVLTAVVLSPVLAFARKTTYVMTDRRFNFVKRVELKKKEQKNRGSTNHPYEFTDLQLRNLLQPIRLSHKLLFKKETLEKEVFNKATLDWIVPYIAKAFKEAKPNEEVVFAFLTSNKTFLVRDDYLTIIHSWVEGDTLRLDFKKLMAKVPNRYDTMSDVSTAMNKAQGLRVSLELSEGQKYGESTDELLIQIPPAGDLPQMAETISPSPASGGQAREEAVSEAKGLSPDDPAEAKLRQLKDLKQKGLITSEEYKEKRKEVLKDL